MNQPEFYVNGTDYPPLDETIAEGSLFHRADGQMMRKVQGVWLLLSELESKQEENLEE